MQLPNVVDTLNRLNAALDAQIDPQAKMMLRVWRDHWWGEVIDDLDTTMKTMPDNPQYRSYGSAIWGEGVAIDSAQEARAMYRNLLDAGLLPGGPFENERIAFGVWGMLLEAKFTSVFPGAMLNGHAAAPDPDALYVVQWQMANLHPFEMEKELMLGELLYIGAPTYVAPAQPGDKERLLAGVR